MRVLETHAMEHMQIACPLVFSKKLGGFDVLVKDFLQRKVFHCDRILDSLIFQQSIARIKDRF